MATHIDAKILNALMGHLTTMTLPASVGGIAYPNVRYDPNGGPYLKTMIFRNSPENNLIPFGKDPIRRGIFQVSVFWPESEGENAPLEVAGLVEQRFVRGTKIAGDTFTVRIDDDPTVGSLLHDAPWVQIPVSIPFITYP